MNEKTMFLCDPTRKPVGKIVFDGEKFQIAIDKTYSSLLEELKALLADARTNGIIRKTTKRTPLAEGGELVSESTQVVMIGDEAFFATVKDTINNTRTFSCGRVFAIIPR